MRFFLKKSLKELRLAGLKEVATVPSQNREDSPALKQTLGALDLIFLGLGGIIGSGIFVITGLAAAEYAGPAIVLSFALAAIACIFTALVFSELAAMVPSSGGAYTYVALALGEGTAALIGWCLLSCMLFGASTVASGWSGYFVGFLHSFGIIIPESISSIPGQGGFVNLPAIFLVLGVSLTLVKGTEGAAKLNGILVIAKLLAIGIFLILAFPHFHIENWQPFIPNGWAGVSAGAGFIFMAYSGFDTVATAAEECKNPNRDLPIGIIGSVLISAFLYMAVSGVLTGITNYKNLNNSEPLAFALRENGVQIGSTLVALGAMAAMSTVVISQIFGFSRVLLMMSRDRIMPSTFKAIHARYGTPYRGLALGTVLTCLLAGFFPIVILGQLGSVCILTVFIFISLSVIILRRRYPNEKRPFRCPAVYLCAGLSAALCLALLVPLVLNFGVLYFSGLTLGFLVYLLSRH